MTVTNVPGPQFPLYLAGSPMTATYPLVPLWESHGVGVAMFSLMGNVNIGLNTDRDVISDPARVAQSLSDSYEELSKAAPKPKTRPRKAPPMGTP
jgi:diacylglycerol O-acyltransferase